MDTQYSQKYSLVQFFEETTIGQSFHMSEWPMHVTLADVFAVTVTDQLHDELRLFIEKSDGASSTVTSEGVLGTTPVWLLDPTPPLVQLHRDIVEILEKHGAVFNTPEFVKDGYIPHITKQYTDTMSIGDTVHVNRLSLIDMFPNNDWQTRVVLFTHPG